MLTLNDRSWKRFFQAPCALVDNYLKLADGPALKVMLYLLAHEGTPSNEDIMKAAGISAVQLEEAVMFWREIGVILPESGNSAPLPIAVKTEPAPVETVTKVVHSRYQPKDIAEMLKSSSELKELFSEAEATLGRILKHADHEVLIALRDYYGFNEQSIVLILGYCAGLGKTSAKYYETVAKSLFDKGATDFHSIETEFERLNEQHSYEAEIKRDFGLDIKLTPRQVQYINSWRDMGFDLPMISLAREKCADATNKLSFQYIDKILSSWKDKGIFSVEAAMNGQKPKKQDTERSFDLDEFDRFTLGGV